MRLAARSVTLGLAGIIAVTQLAGPAVADEAERPDGSTSRPADVRETSPLLGGYAGPGGDILLQATFTVPDFTCAAGETSSALTAILGSRSSTGAPDAVNGGAGVFFLCVNGTKELRSALYEPTGLPQPGGPVAIGDEVRVTYTSNEREGTGTSAFDNLTQGVITVTELFDYIPTTNFQAGNFALTPEGVAAGPIPKVDRVALKPVRVDRKKIKKRKGDLTRYTLVDSGGQPLSIPSKINKGGFRIKPA